MQITEIHIKHVQDNGHLKAFCSVTLDGEFSVHDLKIIHSQNGLLVAMPSRKLEDRCGKCGGKNHLRARFCNECGARLADNRVLQDERGKPKLTIDIALPIDPACRKRLEHQIIEAFQKELLDAKQTEPPTPSD
jgi:stage V sporulation protein G